MNKIIIKRVILTILTIIWMVCIFNFSNEPAVESTESSQSFTKSTIINIYKLFNSNASEEELNNIVELLDTPVRKLGHFTEYLILGVLVYLTLRAYNINNIYIAIAICFLYSCSDEFHQMFVEGRNGNLIDVSIDTLGSSCAILLLSLKHKKRVKSS